MQTKQIIGLLVALVVIVGAIAYLENGKAGPGNSTHPATDVVSAIPQTAASLQSRADRIASKSALYPRAKEIAEPSGFVNTGGQPITLSQYVGKKVILLDIMTYSCINCIRTYPYLVSWYKKYEDKGFVVIGIQTPEFDFEKNIDNVKAAMEKYGITFPVVLDNDYGTWTAYKNLYWPHKYLIDIDGFVRYDHVGEGGYAETEGQIQELLKERADVLGLGDAFKASIDMTVTAGTTEEGAYNETPETYIGSARRDPDNALVLKGDWNSQSEYAENISVPASIVYPITAKHVYLVASADTPILVKVTIDGKPLGSEAGADVVEKDGVDTFTVQESRLYDIYSGDIFGSHTIEVTPQKAGLKAFTFTFGS